MAALLSSSVIPAPASQEQLEVTVRNTFVHVAVQECSAADADEGQQPDLKRAVTTPLIWLREETAEGDESAEEDDEGTEDDESWENGMHESESVDCSPRPRLPRNRTQDHLELSIAGKQPSLRRITTQDHFDSPSSLAHPHFNQIETQDVAELHAKRKRPSFRYMKTYDAFESPVGLDSAAVQSFDGAACVSAARAKAHGAAAMPELPSGRAAHVPQMAIGSTVLQPSVAQEAVGHSSVAQLKRPQAACGKTPPHETPSSRTTIMLRNLPNNYTRAMLLDLIDWAGFAGKYDFLYLPIDFRTHAALGYAFVNLVSPEDAERLRRFLDGFSTWALPSSKVCSAAWSHPFQGYAAHVQRYRNSPLMHEAVPDAYRPILFADGVRIPFPPPTKKIKPPRQGTERMLV